MRQKKTTTPSFEDCKIRNGKNTERRIQELEESVKKQDGSFALEQAKSLGNIEGTSAFLADMFQKFVVPTLQSHERQITTNKWFIWGALFLLVSLTGGFCTSWWYFGRQLFEKAFN